MVQYFGEIIGHLPARNMYLLYDGRIFSMDLVFGDKISGFYSLNFEIDPIDSCKPYAFFVVTGELSIYRLPEDTDYFFATYGIENDNEKCNINHFYNDANDQQWIGNGAPNIASEAIIGVDQSQYINYHETQALEQEFDTFTIDLDIASDTNIPTTIPSTLPTSLVITFYLTLFQI